MMQDADDTVLFDRHADLKLHALDHALAQSGDARFLDPVNSRQLLEDQRLHVPVSARVVSAGLGQCDGAQ